MMLEKLLKVEKVNWNLDIYVILKLPTVTSTSDIVLLVPKQRISNANNDVWVYFHKDSGETISAGCTYVTGYVKVSILSKH